jgi:hypothetical protein
MNNANKYIRAFQRFLYGKPGADGEWRAFDPLHEDPDSSRSPSASFNFELGVWHCASCDRGGTIRSLYRTMREQRGMPSPAEKSQRGKSGYKAGNVIDMNDRRDEKPLPSEEQVKFWHKTLLGKPMALKMMQETRGLTLETLRTYLIGWDGQRFTVPIYDEVGELVNIRRYNPRAKQAGNKMISWGPGHGAGRIYGLEVLEESDWVIVAAGELDRLIGMQEGFPTVTGTSGEGVFKTEWAKYFKGKKVYFAYDDDPQGDAGAMKGAKVLKPVADAIYRVKLDTGIKGGDLTDFFVACGRDADDLQQAIDDASVLHESNDEHKVPMSGRAVSLENSQAASARETLLITAQVAGKVTPAFVVPKKLTAVCDMSAGNVCNSCPLMIENGKLVKELNPDDESLIDFLRRSKDRKNALLLELVGARCKKHVEIRTDAEYEVEELLVAPSPDHIENGDATPINRAVYNVGTYATQENSTVRVVCKQIPDPNDQRGVLMGWDLKPVNTDIDDFQITPAVLKRLQRFRVREGQSPLAKCSHIARDLVYNVTHIYGRELTHIGYDLVWHSITSFNFAGKQVRKGWLEALTIGDTRTGKSEAVTALRKHYLAGVITSCEGASLAGLVGGAVNSSLDKKSWMINWGLLPNNDRRLVVLDEMSGLMSRRDSDILGNMSSIRSEGRAVVRKIVQGETNARTRIIWLSNPADGTNIADLPGSALRAIKNMIRNPEDIARFDFVTAVANNEVPSEVINSLKHKKIPHRYTSQACHDLVMWAWSRKPDQVTWFRGAEQAVLDAATQMGDRYVSDPPLVQSENIRIKIARIAVAIAARTFSATRDGERLIVKKAHVESAVEFLNQVYGSESMGYLRESRRVTVGRQDAHDNKPKMRRYLEDEPHVLAAIRAIGGDTFRSRDFEEQAALERSEANEVMRRLTEWRMIKRGSRGAVRFEPAMTQILREMEDDGH